jgi:hypothetical protein
MYAYEHNHQFQLMVLAAPAGIFLYTWPSIKRSFISPTIKFLEMTSSLTVDTSDPNHILIQEFIMDKIEEYESKRYYRNATSHVKATIKQSKKTWQERVQAHQMGLPDIPDYSYVATNNHIDYTFKFEGRNIYFSSYQVTLSTH